MRFRLCSVLLVLLSAPHALSADPRLPTEGSWSRYYVQHINYGGEERAYEVTLRILGSTTVDGVKCRWIEFYYPPCQQDPIPFSSATKFAIPEETLLTGKTLISDKTHGYCSDEQKGQDREVATIADKRKAGAVFVFEMMTESYLQFLPGPRQTATVTQTRKKVLHAKGELIATEALSGKRSGEYFDTFEGRNHWDGTFQILTNDDIPFGFAYAEFEWDTSFPDEPSLTPSEHWVKKEIWSLQEFGAGAKSSIPEHE